MKKYSSVVTIDPVAVTWFALYMTSGPTVRDSNSQISDQNSVPVVILIVYPDAVGGFC